MEFRHVALPIWDRLICPIFTARIAGVKEGQAMKLAGFLISSMIALSALAAPAAEKGPPEAQNMRLAGAEDLQGRSAYQPVIQQQGGRWIAYIGHHGGSALNPLTGKT